MPIRSWAWILLTGGVFLTAAAAAQPEYGRIMQTALKRSLGPDFKQFEWLSYPTSNFGIATMYILENEKQKANDANQWCASFSCLGLDERRIPAGSDRLTLHGFADVGTGGPVSISQAESGELASSVFLPSIYNLLGLSEHIDITRRGSVTLRLGNLSRRFLRKQEILTYIDGLDRSSPIHRALDENRLAMVVADVVIESLEVDIDLRDVNGGAVTAGLNGWLGRLAGASSTMLVQVKRDKTGQYRLIVNRPVIVARLTMRRPFAGRDVAPSSPAIQLPPDLADWQTWTPVPADSNSR